MQPLMRRIVRAEVDKEKQAYSNLCESRLLMLKEDKKLPTFNTIYGRMKEKHQLEIDAAKSSVMAPSPTNSDISGASPRGYIGRRSAAFREGGPGSTTNQTSKGFALGNTGGVAVPQTPNVAGVPGLDFSRLKTVEE
jgi:hypothetical protein